jgi:hypothetical protein
MSKKDFDELAELVRSRQDVDDVTYASRVAFAEALADFCEKRNPRFDRERFFVACGI